MQSSYDPNASSLQHQLLLAKLPPVDRQVMQVLLKVVKNEVQLDPPELDRLITETLQLFVSRTESVRSLTQRLSDSAERQKELLELLKTASENLSGSDQIIRSLQKRIEQLSQNE